MTRFGISRLAGLVVATLVATTGLVGVSTAPAAAALCSGSGVNVVVDFNGLGGGVQKGCDPGGAGKSGDRVFPAAGFQLRYAQRQPGFVCRVNGSPSNDPCVNAAPANAYWGLYWSNGKSGKWTYASSGVSGISVPDGGFLAFSWQNGGGADPPGAAPVNNQPAPAPTKKPTKAPTRKPTKAPTKAAPAAPTKATGAGGQSTEAARPTRAPASTSASQTAPAASASAAARSSANAKASTPSSAPSTSASTVSEPDATGGATPEADSVEQADGAFTPADEPSGLPTWVPITVLVALAGAAGGAVWWRRRTGPA